MKKPFDYSTDFLGYLVPDVGHPFYVYLLLRPNGKPFYVGKGTGRRISSHEGEARKGNCRCHKCNIIRKIWRQGEQVGRQIIFATNNEITALQVEARTIQRFRNQIVNIADCDPRIHAPPRRERISKQERENYRIERLVRELRDLKSEKRYTNLTGDLEERARLQAAIDAVLLELWPPTQLRLEGT